MKANCVTIKCSQIENMLNLPLIFLFLLFRGQCVNDKNRPIFYKKSSVLAKGIFYVVPLAVYDNEWKASASTK